MSKNPHALKIGSLQPRLVHELGSTRYRKPILQASSCELTRTGLGLDAHLTLRHWLNLWKRYVLGKHYTSASTGHGELVNLPSNLALPDSPRELGVVHRKQAVVHRVGDVPKGEHSGMRENLYVREGVPLLELGQDGCFYWGRLGSSNAMSALCYIKFIVLITHS